MKKTFKWLRIIFVFLVLLLVLKYLLPVLFLFVPIGFFGWEPSARTARNVEALASILSVVVPLWVVWKMARKNRGQHSTTAIPNV